VLRRRDLSQRLYLTGSCECRSTMAAHAALNPADVDVVARARDAIARRDRFVVPEALAEEVNAAQSALHGLIPSAGGAQP